MGYNGFSKIILLRYTIDKYKDHVVSTYLKKKKNRA